MGKGSIALRSLLVLWQGRVLVYAKISRKIPSIFDVARKECSLAYFNQEAFVCGGRHQLAHNVLQGATLVSALSRPLPSAKPSLALLYVSTIGAEEASMHLKQALP
jgi:hypothetical protein